MVSGSADHNIKIWNLATGDIIHSCEVTTKEERNLLVDEKTGIVKKFEEALYCLPTGIKALTKLLDEPKILQELKEAGEINEDDIERVKARIREKREKNITYRKNKEALMEMKKANETKAQMDAAYSSFSTAVRAGGNISSKIIACIITYHI